MAHNSELSKKQAETLTAFREAVQDVARSSHTDDDYLRFLRARNFDLTKSVKMYRDSMQWRKDFDADNLLNYEEPEVLAKYYPGGYCGEDKEGSPIYYELIGYLDMRGMAASVKKQDVIRARMKFAEHTFENMLPAASKKYGRLIYQTTLVYDMDGVGLKSLWKPALDLYNEMLAVLEANYPDGLKTCHVINAPAIFPIAYNIIKPFLSEATKKKIYVLGKNWKKELLKHIDADQLPVHWGGTLTDPDGHPKCPSKICLGGTIPEKYYAQKPDVDLSKFTVQTVGRGSTIQVEALVDSPGMILSWQFWTEGQDIGFGVFRRTGEGRQKKDEMDEIVKSERVNSHLIPESGTFTCDEPGTYILRFDNTYSWVNSKKISYTLEVLEPSSLEEIHAESFVTAL